MPFDDIPETNGVVTGFLVAVLITAALGVIVWAILR